MLADQTESEQRRQVIGIGAPVLRWPRMSAGMCVTDNKREPLELLQLLIDFRSCEPLLNGALTSWKQLQEKIKRFFLNFKLPARVGTRAGMQNKSQKVLLYFGGHRVCAVGS